MASQRTIGRLVRRALRDERGATAIEYALIAVGISIVIATTVFGIGSSLKVNFFEKVSAGFTRP